MVGAPSGLYYLFAILMFAVALYGVALLILTAVERRVGGRDVELSHVAMGIAMGGMFVPGWSFGPDVLWELVFAAFLVWFVVRTVQSVQAWGLHVPHTAIHAVMSFGMLLMYWFPLGATSGAMVMSTTAASGRMDPGLAFLIAFVLFGSAIFTIASPNKGATHFGTHCGPGPRPTVTSPDGGSSVAAPVSTTRVSGFIATPSLLDASHVVMCVGMGLMLILMI
jgi:hypothetical protein